MDHIILYKLICKFYSAILIETKYLKLVRMFESFSVKWIGL